VRVTCALEQLGITPTVTHFLADHARLRRPPSAGGIDAWLTTPRCATKLPGTLGGAPVWPLVTELDVRALVARLERPM
jgi:tetraacyldisaccharide 4'-kinase